jgi:hypothetical protein
MYVRSMPVATAEQIARRFRMSVPEVQKAADEQNWRQSRFDYLKAVEEAAERKSVVKVSDSIGDMNARHRSAWKSVAGVAMTKLNRTVTTVGVDGVTYAELDRLANVLQKAQVGERLALGLPSQPSPYEDASKPPDPTATLLQITYENADDTTREQMRQAAIALAVTQSRMLSNGEPSNGDGA